MYVDSHCHLIFPELQGDIAGVLARMQNMGLIDRQRFDNDQRRVRVSLNARSRTLAERLAPRIEAVYAGIEARVGVEFTRRLYAMLDELVATLDAEDDADASPRAASAD